ncbi:MAG: hypothetical protein F4Y20_08220 [Acidobacteria bacterium]|nr:hypothetical protein [Acidobacteriota bacterium]
MPAEAGVPSRCVTGRRRRCARGGCGDARRRPLRLRCVPRVPGGSSVRGSPCSTRRRRRGRRGGRPGGPGGCWRSGGRPA